MAEEQTPFEADTEASEESSTNPSPEPTIPQMLREESVYAKYKFTEEELKEKASELSDTIQEKENLDDELASVQSQIKSKIKAAEAKIKLLGTHYRDGYEYRNIRCQLWLNYVKKMREWMSLEDGSLVKTEKFQPEDYQKQIPFQPPS